MTTIKISPSSLSELLEKKDVYLVDVREPSEYRREHIAGAVLAPLGDINPDTILTAASAAGSNVCVVCAAGGRSASAAKILQDALAKCGGAYGEVRVHDLVGGMSAWRGNDMPVIEDKAAPLPIIRQVHLIASTLIIAGSVLSRVYSPKFIALPIFVGCGLFLSGSTGFCGMALILKHLPYNK